MTFFEVEDLSHHDAKDVCPLAICCGHMGLYYGVIMSYKYGMYGTMFISHDCRIPNHEPLRMTHGSCHVRVLLNVAQHLLNWDLVSPFSRARLAPTLSPLSRPFLSACPTLVPGSDNSVFPEAFRSESGLCDQQGFSVAAALIRRFLGGKKASGGDLCEVLF